MGRDCLVMVACGLLLATALGTAAADQPPSPGRFTASLFCSSPPSVLDEAIAVGSEQGPGENWGLQHGGARFFVSRCAAVQPGGPPPRGVFR
jgi:hypothetical protein